MQLYNTIFSSKFLAENKIEVQRFFNKINDLENKVKILLDWYNDLKSGKVAQRTEEQQKSEFLEKIFVQVLDYQGDANEWKLEKEFKLPDGSIADSLLGFFGVQKKPIIKVAIEVKKLSIHLDKPQNQRLDKFTPVQQGFHYAQQATNTCDWVIVTNLDEIRLYYAKDYNRYESFLFHELLFEANTAEKNLMKRYPNLAKFFFLLSYGNLYNPIEDTMDIMPLTKKLYQYRMKRLDDISTAFYNEYKQYRQKLYKHIKKQNKNLNLEEEQYFYLAYKIFDRLIFMQFAQETDIVNRKVLVDFILLVKNLPSHLPMFWTNIKAIFKSFDEGYKNDIPPFNGELFKPIALLENINIENEILIEITDFLQKYDFKDELKVDILGHIFEQSIADIENFEVDNQSIRGKDGIFYTPEHITDFIIQTTLVEYLQNEKEKIYQSLQIDFLSEIENDFERWKDEKPNFNYQNAIEIYADFFQKYKNILSNIKILDPACGSGAFLTRIFDYLFKENQIVYKELDKFENKIYEQYFENKINTTKKIKPKTKINKSEANALRFEQEIKINTEKKNIAKIARDILLNNIFGTDINRESIEITKLSLWLKTANRYGITLANLQNNIKQGNSLIENKDLDKRAFDWQHQQFDIIIGNPPYFSLSTQPENILQEYQKNYKVFEKTSDIYCLFFEKGLQLLKPKGILAYITSKQWTNTNYGKKLRQFLVENANPSLFIDFNGIKIFKDATVDSSILVIKNEKCTFQMQACSLPNDFDMLKNNIKEYTDKNLITLKDLNAEKWTIAQENILTLKQKIKNAGNFLKDWNIKILRGLLTGLNEAFIIDENKKNELIKKDKKSAELIMPLLRGRDVHQYSIKYANLYLILTKNGIDIKNYKAIFEHLKSFGEDIKNRTDQGENWWNLRACAYYDKFAEQKIIYPETTGRGADFYLDKEGMYIDKTCFMITGEHLAFLNGILTSSLMSWYLKTEIRTLGKTGFQYSKQYMENVPLPIFEKINTKLYTKISEITIQLTDLSKQGLQKTNSFLDLKNELDKVVFELYGLDKKEIGVIL